MRNALATAASMFATLLLAAPAVHADALKLAGVSLLQPDEILSARVRSVDDVAVYLKALETKAAAYFSSLASGIPRSGHLVVAAKPARATNAWISVDPPLPEAQAKALIDRLRAVAPPDVRDGPIVFALKISIDDAPAPTEPVPKIKEWAQAVEQAGRALTIDEILLRAWPP